MTEDDLMNKRARLAEKYNSSSGCTKRAAKDGLEAVDWLIRRLKRKSRKK